MPLEVLKSFRHQSSQAVRPAVFHNVLGEEDIVSSDGGTIILALCQGQVLGVTCRHVVNTRDARDLIVHFDLQEMKAIKPHVTGYIRGTSAELEGTEVEDVLLLALDNRERRDDTRAILIDEAIAPEIGDRLVVTGFPKDRMEFSLPRGRGFCFEAEVIDEGQPINDPHLRAAHMTYDNVETERATGLSGGLVFNLTKQAPAGIVIRASEIRNDFRIHYLPFAPILPLIQGFATRNRTRIAFDFGFRLAGTIKNNWLTSMCNNAAAELAFPCLKGRCTNEVLQTE